MNKLSKKLRETGMTAALKTYRISLVFLFRNIHTQTGYYKKG